eukprot:scaffold198861_cov27-Tisochrysis_lutea.AAC.1
MAAAQASRWTHLHDASCIMDHGSWIMASRRGSLRVSFGSGVSAASNCSSSGNGVDAISCKVSSTSPPSSRLLPPLLSLPFTLYLYTLPFTLAPPPSPSLPTTTTRPAPWSHSFSMCVGGVH